MKLNLDELIEKVELTTEKLDQPARIEIVTVEEEKFFAYEKQKSHN